MEQRKYIDNYTNDIEFPTQKINNIKNRNNKKSIVTVLGKQYWMCNRKIETYKKIGIVLGVISIAAEFLLLYIYLWYMSF